jgi:quinolinate synthase
VENNNLKNKILELKNKKNAIILAHLYQFPEVQEIADFAGDSYGLSKTANETDADVIVFCGVHFMAETASIICPNKTVLLPEIEAGCPMAEMIKPKDLQKLKDKNPNAIVVTYINSTAEIKAMSDIVCTSANAVKIVKNLPSYQKDIIFIPDKYLGSFVAKNNPDRNIILFDGYCNVHSKILSDDVKNLKEKYPKSIILVHPECRGEVVDMADEVLSTTGMINFAKDSKEKEFIVCTEIGIMYKLQKDNPDKIFHHISKLAVCPNMKKTTLEKVLFSLEDMKYIITVDQKLAKSAKCAIDNMFKYSK